MQLNNDYFVRKEPGLNSNQELGIGLIQLTECIPPVHVVAYYNSSMMWVAIVVMIL